MKKQLAELYALEIAGLSCLDVLEKLVSGLYGWTQEELASKYSEITTKINSQYHCSSDLAFRELIYKEYMELFFKEEK